MRGSTDSGAIDVVWCPNPMRPIGDRQIRSVLLTGTDTVDSIVRRLALKGTPLVANLNGSDLRRRRWYRKRVRRGDVLVLRQAARGAEVGAYAAGAAYGKTTVTVATALAIGAVVTFAVNTVIALAVSALLSSLTKKKAGSSSASQDNSPAAYGVEGGANDVRPYEPLLLVLGEHRVFPDYASRPFSEFVYDPTTATEVYNTTEVTEQQVPRPFTFYPAVPPAGDGETGTPASASSPWVLIGTVGDPSVPTGYFFGDGLARSYVRPEQLAGNLGPAGPVNQPHTFVVRHAPGAGGSDDITEVTTYESYIGDIAGIEGTWVPKFPSPILTVLIRYGYTAVYNTERLTSIFNLGFGDLIGSDVRIGSSAQSSFNAVERHDSSVPAGDRTQLLGYTSTAWPGNAYPDNVQSVDGGKVEQNAVVANGGWIERSGSQGARYLQVDVAGRLFLQSGAGMANASCTCEAQYQPVGSDTWLPLPFSPFTLTNGSTTPVRQTYSCMLDAPADAVRVRRTTPDSTEASLISELEFTRVKFFRTSTALYPAQRRMGVMIKATGQLSGRIDRLSAFVQAKHWRWIGNAPWDGSMPAAGAGAWSWGPTVNPAWLFLYYARGGFLNTTAAPAHLGLAGWLDAPAIGNGPRLFGAGLTNDRIDYATLVAWGQFCDAANLTCRMAVTARRSAGEVLDDIAAAGRATKTWAPGKLSVVWEAAGQPTAAAFGMSNVIAGTFSVSYSSDDTVDEYALNYVRTDADYEADTVYATVPGVVLPTNQQSEQAVYSMPRQQAQRLVNLLAAARHFHRRIIKWETNIMGLTVQRGDIVKLAHDLTRWAYSGRLVDLVAADGQITSVTLSAEVENPAGAAEFYLWVCKPTGVYMSVRCTPPAARTRTLQVLAGQWAVVDAPGLLSGVAKNLASALPRSIPEDWTFFAGPVATPGKRVRIINIEPANGRRFRLTARDEYEAYYPLEWGVGNPAAPASGEQLVARVFNLATSPAAGGGMRLAWELEAAYGAHVMVSVNSGPAAQVPVQGYLTVSGTELLLPAYAPGTRLDIQVLPVAAGAPVRVEGDSLTLMI